jgi:hypothetical protein
MAIINIVFQSFDFHLRDLAMVQVKFLHRETQTRAIRPSLQPPNE